MLEKIAQLAQEYFDLKRQLLGYDRLKNTDLYAPVVADNKQFSYVEAMELVQEKEEAAERESNDRTRASGRSSPTP